MKYSKNDIVVINPVGFERTVRASHDDTHNPYGLWVNANGGLLVAWEHVRPATESEAANLIALESQIRDSLIRGETMLAMQGEPEYI